MIAMGTLLYSFGVGVFMLPYKLTSGGVSGISAIVYYATGFEAQNTYLIINIFFLLVAIKLLGFKFCLKTIWGVASTTFWLWLMQRMIEDPVTHALPQLAGEHQEFLACVIASIIEGIGLFLCFSNNGSTGGTDIIAAIINKYKSMSLGQVIMACDIVIISSCYFVFHDWQRVVFGFVMLFISSFTLDYCINRNHESVQFMIFSRNYARIADAINTTGRGVTVLDGTGWYTKSERKVIVVLAKRREQVNILRMIKLVDPYAFVSMTKASGVFGEGFDKMKVKENKRNKGKRTLVFASNSKHKLEEVRAIFGDKYDIRSLEDIGCDIYIPERAGSIQGNALLKARFVKKYYGFDCFADETALECNALGGLPGIYSSRYASVDDSMLTEPLSTMEVHDESVSREMLDILHSRTPVIDDTTRQNVDSNVAKLLDRLSGQQDRTAQLHTVVALITGDYDANAYETHCFEGILRGKIAEEQRGEDSFFYDSVFIPEGYEETYYELGMDQKNKISQRAIAISKLKEYVETTGKPSTKIGAKS